MPSPSSNRAILWDAQAEQRFLGRLANASPQESVHLFQEMQEPPLSPHPGLLAQIVRRAPTFLGRVMVGLMLADDLDRECQAELALAQLAPATPDGRTSLDHAMARLCESYDAERGQGLFERMLDAGIPLYEPMEGIGSPSPFMALCAREESLPTLRWLVEHRGARDQVDTLGPNGHTPLSFALVKRCLPAMVFLIEHGADPHRKTRFATPEDMLKSGPDDLEQAYLIQSPMEAAARTQPWAMPELEAALARARHARGGSGPGAGRLRARRRT